MQNNRNLIGSILAIFGSILWGIQGPVSQFLFQNNGYSPEWLMGVKMLISGILILLFAKGVKKRPIMNIWHHKHYLGMIFAYAILGLSAVQYLYLVTVRASNAGTATILQSLGTIFIVIFTAIFYHKLPSKSEGTAVIVALIGTWLLVTKGDLFRLAITKDAMILGILLALAGATQTLLPARLMERFNSFIVVGWSMIIGGILFTIIHPFWINAPHFTLGTFLGVAFIVLFGTMMSFLCFTNSLRFISPTIAGMLNTFEPLSATIGTILFLHTPFNVPETIGGILILSTVFILAIGKRKNDD